jgi:hypothetical protein
VGSPELGGKLEDDGGRLVVAAGFADVLRLFEVTGVERLFAVYPSLPTALAALGVQPALH